MADITAKALRELQGALDVRIGQKAPTVATTQTATVTGAKAGALSVMLDGATTSTPASSSVCAVSVGDRVTVQVSGGSLAITGNVTAPATSQQAVNATVAPVAADASQALASSVEAATAAAKARQSAESAGKDAEAASQAATKASEDAGSAGIAASRAQAAANAAEKALGITPDEGKTADELVAQSWFWTDSLGAHVVAGRADGTVTSATQTDVNSAGLSVARTSDHASVAFFGVEQDGDAYVPTSRVGAENAAHTVTDTTGIHMYDGDSEAAIAEIAKVEGEPTRLYISEAEVTDNMQMANFAWFARDGHLSLRSTRTQEARNGN